MPIQEKNAFSALVDLLPLSPPIRDQLDKTGILRISIAFLQLHQLVSALMDHGKGSSMEEERTIKENREARQLQRQWAMKRRKAAEPLRQFAFNLFQARKETWMKRAPLNSSLLLLRPWTGSPLCSTSRAKWCTLARLWPFIWAFPRYILLPDLIFSRICFDKF